MRRFTTSVATDRTARLAVGLLLVVELLVAIALVGRARAEPTGLPEPAVKPPPTAAAPAGSALTPSPRLRDGRTAEVLVLGGNGGHELAVRIAGELAAAADAVTAFWGDDWPRHVVIALTGTDEEFRAIGGGGSDIAATTTGQRIVFAPAAVAMSTDSLRIVLRHELFHYAARAKTAPDGPRWLTEGVADFVGRPPAPLPGPQRAAELAVLPSDADLDTPGEPRSLAYDRAWWFSRFVADRYGTDSLARLYLAACGPGHTDADTAVRTVLRTDTAEVLAAWRAWLAG
jgi:hypothetical protein